MIIFKFFHALWTNENETWKIEKLKNPGNRFSTYAQIIGCNIKSLRPRKKNFTSWNNWNIELSIDTLVLKIERKLFPQLLIPLLHSFFLRHPVFSNIKFFMHILHYKVFYTYFPISSFLYIFSNIKFFIDILQYKVFLELWCSWSRGEYFSRSILNFKSINRQRNRLFLICINMFS